MGGEWGPGDVMEAVGVLFPGSGPTEGRRLIDEWTAEGGGPPPTVVQPSPVTEVPPLAGPGPAPLPWKDEVAAHNEYRRYLDTMFQQRALTPVEYRRRLGDFKELYTSYKLQSVFGGEHQWPGFGARVGDIRKRGRDLASLLGDPELLTRYLNEPEAGEVEVDPRLDVFREYTDPEEQLPVALLSATAGVHPLFQKGIQEQLMRLWYTSGAFDAPVGFNFLEQARRRGLI